MKMTDRIQHAWNAFTNTEKMLNYDRGYGSSRPMHKTVSVFNTSSYVASIYNRIAMDASMTEFNHVRVDQKNEDETDIKSGINNCLTVEANIDQTHIQFLQDVFYSMFDEGVIAVVPVDTSISPEKTGGYEINSLRVGKIVNWFPKHVEIRLYNDHTGQNENITLAKANVAIVENPLYAVVNDENSTLKRLIRKLAQMDDIDAQASAGRLDLLISIPYGIKTENQRVMAEKRIKDIELQLASGRNGIAYIDGTEKAMQLNRPVNSQLQETIESLQQQFYNQLGLTETIFNGTASEVELRTYYTRTIDPIVDNLVAELNRKFITKTARTQGHTITYRRDMFKMVPAETIASLGDTFRRNYIATSNEIRKIVGFKPSNDPRADELFNPNIADNNQNPTEDGPDQGPEETRLIKPPKEDVSEVQRLQNKLDKLEREKPGSLTPPDKESK